MVFVGNGMPVDKRIGSRRVLGRKRVQNKDKDNYLHVDDRGWTTLHVACRKGDLKLVRKLLDEGADVNVLAMGPKCPGATPLHLAATGGHVKVMDELLERGADIDARTKGGCGWTPLHYAAKEKSKKALEFLVENGAFLPPDINDGRFNPELHYCPGLELAYEIKKQNEIGLLSSDGTCSEENNSDMLAQC